MDKSLIKAITWNTIAFTITTVVTYAWTGTVELSLTIGVSERLLKIAVYYLHEKVWK